MKEQFDVIIIGGSYSGLAAGMALGRALRKVLIIDSGKPCNRQTPHSHNFLTHDGKAPAEIAALARQQVAAYKTVEFMDGLVESSSKRHDGFEVDVSSGETFTAKKLIFATGISDVMPDIPGFAGCWGISALHCPYCHGYEVKGQKTGVLANGDAAFEFCSLLSNWTNDLTLYTNGKSTLNSEQVEKLNKHNINIVEAEIAGLEHSNGYLQNIVFEDGSKAPVEALYSRRPFAQHCDIPQLLGCELTEEGYLKIDGLQKTNVPGVFACGDNATRIRTVANAVSTGTFAGMAANKELIDENF